MMIRRIIVSDDPTDEMISAAEDVDWSDEDTRGSIINMWHVMLAAAPPASQDEELVENVAKEMYEYTSIYRSSAWWHTVGAAERENYISAARAVLKMLEGGE